MFCHWWRPQLGLTSHPLQDVLSIYHMRSSTQTTHWLLIKWDTKFKITVGGITATHSKSYLCGLDRQIRKVSPPENSSNWYQLISTKCNSTDLEIGFSWKISLIEMNLWKSFFFWLLMLFRVLLPITTANIIKAKSYLSWNFFKLYHFP